MKWKNHIMSVIIVTIGLIMFGFRVKRNVGNFLQNVISGTIRSDVDSSPIEGAEIKIKGKSSITGTMPDGAFSLEISEKDSILQISKEGYEPQEIKISKEVYYEIRLGRKIN